MFSTLFNTNFIFSVTLFGRLQVLFNLDWSKILSFGKEPIVFVDKLNPFFTEYDTNILYATIRGSDVYYSAKRKWTSIENEILFIRLHGQITA